MLPTLSQCLHSDNYRISRNHFLAAVLGRGWRDKTPNYCAVRRVTQPSPARSHRQPAGLSPPQSPPLTIHHLLNLTLSLFLPAFQQLLPSPSLGRGREGSEAALATLGRLGPQSDIELGVTVRVRRNLNTAVVNCLFLSCSSVTVCEIFWFGAG